MGIAKIGLGLGTPASSIVASCIPQMNVIIDKTKELPDIPELIIDDDISEGIGIRHALLTSVICYCVGLYDASITYSSVAVECVLNWDRRMQDHIRQGQWLLLKNSSLKTAKDQGLPIEELLYDNESISDLKSNSDPVMFVKLRNKFTHGEYEAMNSIWRTTKWQDITQDTKLENERDYPFNIYIDSGNARKQLTCAVKFVTKWAEEDPLIVTA